MTSTITFFPDEIWSLVFYFVKSHVPSVYALGNTCRHLRSLSVQDKLWYEVYRYQFPRLTQALNYREDSTGETQTWRHRFLSNWHLYQEWQGYFNTITPEQLNQPLWQLILGHGTQPFSHATRRLVIDRDHLVTGYGVCILEDSYEVILWESDPQLLRTPLKFTIENPDRCQMELIAISARRGLFVVALCTDIARNFWHTLQVYCYTDDTGVPRLVSEFRPLIVWRSFHACFDLPGAEENELALIGILYQDGFPCFLGNYNYLDGKVRNTKTFGKDICVVNYHCLDTPDLLYLTTCQHEIMVWNFCEDQSTSLLKNYPVLPWGTEPMVIFNGFNQDNGVSKRSIRCVTIADDDMNRNQVLLWNLEVQNHPEEPIKVSSNLISETELRSEHGVFGAYCGRDTLLVTITIDGVLQIYDVNTCEKMGHSKIPIHYNESDPNQERIEYYDITILESGEVLVCTSIGLWRVSPSNLTRPETTAYILQCSD
ncbi:hypothetical protein K7432_005375 [Basidiobolus ranarum]|uniref:F-box domain-containing protein n=1 Tax=Basidiobolus ranarum TaxID=34480 RepID=A0ABR2W394_9FUNG